MTRPKLPQVPPADLAARRPTWVSRGPDDVVWRFADSTGAHPTGAAQLRSFGPLLTARFDPHEPPPHDDPREGVLYAADTLLTAVAERFQRTREVRRDTAGTPVAYAWSPLRALNLLDLTGPGAVALGASHSISGARKDVTRAWARGLRRAFPEADGVLYSSAMTGEPCLALWAPAADALPPTPAFARRLDDPATDWQDVLRSAAAALGWTFA